jgi:hypothetical protein
LAVWAINGHSILILNRCPALCLSSGQGSTLSVFCYDFYNRIALAGNKQVSSTCFRLTLLDGFHLDGVS